MSNTKPKIVDSGVSLMGLEMKISDLEARVVFIQNSLKKIEEIMDLIPELKKAVEFINGKYEEMKSNMENLEKEQVLLKKDIQHMKVENETLKKDLAINNKVTLELFSNKNDCKCEIVGIPMVKGEQVVDLVLTCASTVQSCCQKSDIVQVERIVKKVGLIHPMVVTFKKKEIREDFVKKMRKHRLTCDKVNFTGNVQKIFVNDILMNHTKQLLYKCRKFKQEHNWKFVWIKEGQILMRKEEGSKVIEITDEYILLNLIG